MKITMTSLETNEVVMESEGKTLVDVVVASILDHTREFGDEYLGELMSGLAELSNGEIEYVRTEFSDPEANFNLTLTE